MLNARILAMLVLTTAACSSPEAIEPAVEPNKPKPKLEIPDTCPRATAPAMTLSSIVPHETRVGLCGDLAFYDMLEGAQLRTVGGEILSFGSHFGRDFDVQGDILALTTQRLPDAASAITDPRSAAWSFRDLRSSAERKAAEFGPAESYGFGYDHVQHASYGLIATASAKGTKVERWSPRATWPALQFAEAFSVLAHARASSLIAARQDAADESADTSLLLIDIDSRKVTTTPLRVRAYDKVWLNQTGELLIVERMDGPGTFDVPAVPTSSKLYRTTDASLSHDFGKQELLRVDAAVSRAPIERLGAVLLPRAIAAKGKQGAYVVDVATGRVTDGGERDALGVLANGDVAFADERSDGQGAVLLLHPADGTMRAHGAVGAGQVAGAVSDDGTVASVLPKGVEQGDSAPSQLLTLPALNVATGVKLEAHRNVSADSKLFDLWCSSAKGSCSFTISGTAYNETLSATAAGALLGVVGVHGVRALPLASGTLGVQVVNSSGVETVKIESGIAAAQGVAMVYPLHGRERGVVLFGGVPSGELELVHIPRLAGAGE